MSDELYRIYGFDPKEGVPSWEERQQRVHPEDRNNWRKAIEKATREKSDCEMEFRILLPDGTVKWIHSVSHPVLTATGELVEFVGSSSDVTERKLAEEALERLRKLEAELAHMNRVSVMGEMAASLAHEIKQPITAATTNAQICLWLLEKEKLDVSEMREASSAVAQSVRRAADIIDRVRALFKKSAQDRELVDVNQVVREIDAMLRNESRVSSVMTNLQLSDSVPQVKGDRVQLQQVVMNLMLNAIEAMKDSGGELVVTSARTDGGQVLVSVSDCGVGLPKGKEEHVFDAFFTTVPTRALMNLPAGANVFVIDDDEEVRASIQRLLKTVGLQGQTFARAQDFLQLKTPEVPSCLVLDVRLPGMSGLEVQRQLVAAGINIPIIFISAHADVDMAVRAMKLGAVEFLTKPFRPQELVDVIQQTLQRDAARLREQGDTAALQQRYRTLTARERQVMDLFASGLSTKQMASKLGVTEVTAAVHRGHVMQKMHAGSPAELGRMAEKLNLSSTKES
jgi:PAS domain S-box-containing protein